MRIYGLDFTSAPRPNKPIICSVCDLKGTVLRILDFCEIINFEEFDAFLNHKGPWVAGIDFPFGQPRKLVENLGWPNSWGGYVGLIASMCESTFEETLNAYRASRRAGDKQHLREVDRKAGSRSPMMLYGVPVAKMFFRGAPRLLKSHVSILPCRPCNDNRIVLEAYPALVARRWIGNRSYKNDQKKRQTAEQRKMRRGILDSLRSRLPKFYGLDVNLGDQQAEFLLDDPSADRLDAVLCAIQAGWAYAHRTKGYGIPDVVDSLEGWIVDPKTIEDWQKFIVTLSRT